MHFQSAGHASVNGVIVGEKVTLTVEFEGAGAIQFEGRIQGENMTGQFTEGDKTGEFDVQMVAGGATNFQA